MKNDFNRLLAAAAVMMCVFCIAIVVMDDDLNAAEFGDPEGPEGSMDNPYVVTSSMISSDAGSIFEMCTADTVIGGDHLDVYFKFLPGARVDIYAFENSDYSLYCTDPGTLSYDDMNPGYNGMVYGTATEDFEIIIYGPEKYLVLHFTADANIVLFTSADTLVAVSNDGIEYTATTNSSATFSEIGGTAASWLEIDPGTGQLSGTSPEVDSTTTFTYEIEAVSTTDTEYSATLVLTITVKPELRFLSDPAVDGIIVPPNHHLLTFMFEGEILMHAVVEHGGTFDLESLQDLMDEHGIVQFKYFPYGLEVSGQYRILASDTVIEGD